MTELICFNAYDVGVAADLARAYELSGKSQFSVMEINEPEISNYGVVIPNGSGAGIAGLVEKPDANDAPSNMVSIGRYVLTANFFDTLRGLNMGSGGEFQLVDAINIHAQQGLVETVRLNGQCFDCGSVDWFMRASNDEYQKRLAV